MGRFTLTPIRLAILQFIRQYVDEHGRFPARSEIARACGIRSDATLHYHLRVLEQAGYITLPEAPPPMRKPQRRLPGQTTPEIMEWADKAETVPIPLLGTIAAGEPISVVHADNWTNPPEDIIPVPAHLVRGKKNLFALRVKGKSMVDAYIDDGDIVILEHVRTVENGQMAAVWLRNEQETTLKKVHREGNYIKLQPANHTMKPTYHRPDNVDIQGRVVAVIRKFEA
jgi:repressor LexA